MEKRAIFNKNIKKIKINNVKYVKILYKLNKMEYNTIK
jgi:hypothetical protein